MLRGYTADQISIANFFENSLNYEVLAGQRDDIKLEDLAYNDFDQTLNDVKGILSSGSYDRFFLFILSHGDDKGILTNEPGSKKKIAEDKAYSVDKVIAKFNHINLPNMRGFPKCIFVQACRGTGNPEAAADSSREDSTQETQSPDPSQQEGPFQETSLPKMANGGDVLVCYPSEAGHYSYLTPAGSFLIQEVISAIKKYYSTEHLLDILAEVTYEVGLTIRPKKSMETGRTEEVSQMPHIVTTLTKKFYLYIEQNER